MLATTYAPATVGMNGQLITIECDMSSGLPGLVIVGLGDKAVDEARERIRSAIKNSGFVLPPKRITLNLAPADLPKDGSGYDLSMAMAVLCASGQLDVSLLERTILLGELSLNGTLKPAKSALTAAQLCVDAGYDRLIIAHESAESAAQIAGVTVFGVSSLSEAFHHINGQNPLTRAVARSLQPIMESKKIDIPDFSDIRGQHLAKRAVQIATAGGHNLLLSGPPGTGKTMLAKSIIGLLPPLTQPEAIEVTKIYALIHDHVKNLVTIRPFRAPHHTASSVALVGGGSKPRPGEISLAHHGVLFMDELPEFPRSVLEVLRQPLEEGYITVARASGSISFPAEFMLIATSNPCVCGFYGDPMHNCNCSPGAVLRYQQRISGPLMDRIDLFASVLRQPISTQNYDQPGITSKQTAVSIATARDLQRLRNNDLLNARMTETQVRKHCKINNETNQILTQATEIYGLSNRSHSRILKIARTIADLNGSQNILLEHVTEALQYRPISHTILPEKSQPITFKKRKISKLVPLGKE